MADSQEKKLRQPKSPKGEGVDPLTQAETMYPREDVKADSQKATEKNRTEINKGVAASQAKSARIFNASQAAENTTSNKPPHSPDYKAMNVGELKEIAKARELTGYSSMNKDELVALLEKNDGETFSEDTTDESDPEDSSDDDTSSDSED